MTLQLSLYHTANHGSEAPALLPEWPPKWRATGTLKIPIVPTSSGRPSATKQLHTEPSIMGAFPASEQHGSSRMDAAHGEGGKNLGSSGAYMSLADHQQCQAE